jgi:hypothetical protein
VRLCGFLPRPLIRLGLVSCGVWQLCVLGLGWVLFSGDEKGAGLTLGLLFFFVHNFVQVMLVAVRARWWLFDVACSCAAGQIGSGGVRWWKGCTWMGILRYENTKSTDSEVSGQK